MAVQVVGADLLIISGAILLGLLVAVVVGVVWVKRKESEEVQMARELRESRRKSGGVKVQDPSRPSTLEPEKVLETTGGLKPAAKPSSMFVPKKDNVVTSKTREELDNLMGSLKSISQEIERPPEIEISDEDVKSKLQDSGLIQGLVDTLITQVKTDEDNTGKFSKMMIEGHLLFEDELVEPKDEEKK